MRAMIALVLSCLVFTACADSPELAAIQSPGGVSTVPADPPSPTPEALPDFKGDKRFAPYVARFIREGAKQGRKLSAAAVSIRLSDLEQYGERTIGVCFRGCADCPKVLLKDSFWATASEARKRLLFDHELGHCVLQRPHRTTLLASGKPASIMYPFILDERTYREDLTRYQRELYTYRLAPAALEGLQIDICE